MAVVRIINHVKEFEIDVEEAILNALEVVGMQAENYAKVNLTNNGTVDTGALRNSITHKVISGEKAVIIGTNLEYAPYVELGTGQYVAGGRPTPWVYQDAKGNWHRTKGQKPQPFLKPVAEEHGDELGELFRKNLAMFSMFL